MRITSVPNTPTVEIETPMPSDKIGCERFLQLLWPVRFIFPHRFPHGGYVVTYLELEVIFHQVKTFVVNFPNAKTFSLYVRSGAFKETIPSFELYSDRAIA